ncbi:hypothetical protein COCON_G00103530 [Conger conger]|uniref:Uncharacterized protein n=1 Tax=Conger conger TaxID=82655 RepID=A0A9Q1DID3_CONCO|nr:hypothetical protein COCON_G00103530 [Conger conger]
MLRLGWLSPPGAATRTAADANTNRSDRSTPSQAPRSRKRKARYDFQAPLGLDPVQQRAEEGLRHYATGRQQRDHGRGPLCSLLERAWMTWRVVPAQSSSSFQALSHRSETTPGGNWKTAVTHFPSMPPSPPTAPRWPDPLNGGTLFRLAPVPPDGSNQPFRSKRGDSLITF